MSREQLQELISQTEALTNEEKRQLANYLLEQLNQPEVSTTTDSSSTTEKSFDPRRTLEYEWLAQHRSEYAGHYVALDGNRLLSYGTDGREVIAKARKMGVKSPYIVHIEPLDAPPFGGW
jgi:hypothetical protein